MKCYFDQSDAQGQCQTCGRFICRHHSQVRQGYLSLSCSECVAEAIRYESERAEAEARAEKIRRETDAVVEQQRRKEQAAFHEKFRKEKIAEWMWLGIMNGGLFGFLVGFFRSCSVQHLSIDLGACLVTLLLGAVVGRAIGRWDS